MSYPACLWIMLTGICIPAEDRTIQRNRRIESFDINISPSRHSTGIKTNDEHLRNFKKKRHLKLNRIHCRSLENLCLQRLEGLKKFQGTRRQSDNLKESKEECQVSEELTAEEKFYELLTS